MDSKQTDTAAAAATTETTTTTTTSEAPSVTAALLSSPRTVAIPLPRVKIVHLIRHAEATHNAAARQFGDDAMRTPEHFDAALSPKGLEQAAALRAQLSTCKFTPDVVLVSPLRRALQTACIGLQDVTAPFVAVEDLRERIGMWECDKRRGRPEQEREFPRVDFAGINATDVDPVWTLEHRETPEEITARGNKVLAYLRSRPEREIVVVTHSSFLQHMLQKGDIDLDDEYRQWFQNCEMRSLVMLV